MRFLNMYGCNNTLVTSHQSLSEFVPNRWRVFDGSTFSGMPQTFVMSSSREPVTLNTLATHMRTQWQITNQTFTTVGRSKPHQHPFTPKHQKGEPCEG